MQTRLFTLLRTQFQNTSWFQRVRYEKDPKKKNRMIAIGLLMVFVFILLAGYCFAVSYGLGRLGLTQVIPGYTLTITSIVTLIFTILKTNSYLFAFPDYDLLMSLPFPVKTVISAKFLYMYGANLLFTFMVFLPMGAGYAIFARPSAVVYVIWIGTALVAPLLPMTIASALGAAIVLVGGHSRHKTGIQVLLTMLFLLGIFGASLFFQTQSTKPDFNMQLTQLGEQLSQQIHNVVPLAFWFDCAVTQSRFLPFAILCAISLIWYTVFLCLVAKYYRSINTALTTYHTKGSYHIGKMKQHSVLWALVKKEGRRFTSSVTYITNMGIGLFLTILFALVIAIVGIDKLLGAIPMSLPRQTLLCLLPFALAMPLNMCCTTCVSLSLEGKQLWIVESLPISKKTLLYGKMLFQLLLATPFCLISTLVLLISLKAPLLLSLCCLLTGCCCLCFSTVWGMWVNLLFPNFTWTSEVEVIKQSMSAGIGIFSNLLLYFVLAALCFFLGSKLPAVVILPTISLLLLLAAGALLKKIHQEDKIYGA